MVETDGQKATEGIRERREFSMSENNENYWTIYHSRTNIRYQKYFIKGCSSGPAQLSRRQVQNKYKIQELQHNFFLYILKKIGRLHYARELWKLIIKF